ncbi:MAG: hypothetical protein LAT81_14345 [Oceanicaulis sp.]|nr:hypothetical protein [Oceanicaulis sp.]
MSNLKKIENKLKLTLNSLSPNQVLFITGAGISVASPTSFANGNELHELFLKKFSKLTFSERNRLIDIKFPFEKTCQIIVDSYGIKKIESGENIGWHLISSLFEFSSGKMNSNNYHEYFRLHLKNGGIHITANIDQFIEEKRLTINPDFQITTTQKEISHNSITRYNSEYEGCLLYKFHGDVNIDNVGEQGFLLRLIEKGFPDNIKLLWGNLISQQQLVIFVGYGGVDNFDVKKYFCALSSRHFASTSAIWIDYSKNNAIEIKEDFGDKSTYLEPFNSAIRIECPANLILNNLFKGKFQIQNVHRNPNKINSYIDELFQVNSSSIPDSIIYKVTDQLRYHLNAKHLLKG